ncbi:MAG: LysM peptidoglycan-binding domain-containing protein [Anaerolineae bacterium]|nr:LysM peptidoglycan-binding domain-containing protein [Anaerolineae bacterium]
MKHVQYVGAFLVCFALLAGCGQDKKDKESSITLPQQITYFDGAVTFSLPDGWMSEIVPDPTGLAFVIVNSQAVYDDTENKHIFVNLAPVAFANAYDPSITLEDLDLARKENLATGTGLVLPLTGADEGKSPAEIIELYYQLAAEDMFDDGSETAAANKAWFDLDKSAIKTFENGAFSRFDTAGGLRGVIGVVQGGQNVSVIFLVTDKPDQYMDTFEAIIRSVHVSEASLLTPTPPATEEPTLTITPTPRASVTPWSDSTATPFSASGVTRPPADSTATPVNIIGVTRLPVDSVVTPFSTLDVTPWPTATPFQPASTASPSPACMYIVQAGDTVIAITVILGVSVDDLVEANPSIADGDLEIGQELVIPGCPN